MIQSAANELLALKVQGKTGKSAVFIKLNDVYPECAFLIKGADQLYPLRCIKDDHCPRNQNCMGKLAKRVKFIFDTFADCQVLLLYFTYPDRPGTHRAGVFWRSMTAPRFITFNRSMWDKMKEIGIVYSWTLPSELMLS